MVNFAESSPAMLNIDLRPYSQAHDRDVWETEHSSSYDSYGA